MIAAEPVFPRNQTDGLSLISATFNKGDPYMNNPNQSPGQQNQNPGQKPGQQQQDPSRRQGGKPMDPDQDR